MKREKLKFVIEKGVPVPEVKVSYPFDEMEVGDSFMISVARVAVSFKQNLAFYCEKNSTNRKKRFFLAVIDNNHSRCWRIK